MKRAAIELDGRTSPAEGTFAGQQFAAIDKELGR